MFMWVEQNMPQGIYARFWHKFLFDLGVVNYKEPFMRLYNVGLILAEDGKKMSKRYGNVVNPDDVINIWGADTFRLYTSFMGPFNQEISWKTDNMIGQRRFLERVWRFSLKVESNKAQVEQLSKFQNFKLENLLHKTIKKVTEDVENFNFNTAVSNLMILLNELESKKAQVRKQDFETFLKLLAPFAPHMTEEIWSHFGHKESIHLHEWPKYDESKIKEEKTMIVVQINGKVRAQFEAETGISQKEAEEKALAMPEVQKWLGQSKVKKTIFVQDKILSFVIE